MKELVIKKCLKCGAMVEVIRDCECDDCGIKCCGQEMKEIVANSSDGAVEKHKPTYVIDGNSIIVSVNHVMDDDHYIEWICLLTGKKEEYRFLRPGEVARVEFNKEDNGKLYSYCNKHGLWVEDIK